MSPKNHDAEGEKTVASNRRARHDYEIIETYECGIVLTGDEVKSLRGGRATHQRGLRSRAQRRDVAGGDARRRRTSRATSAATTPRGPASCCCTATRSNALIHSRRSSDWPSCRCACTSRTAWRRWSSGWVAASASTRSASRREAAGRARDGARRGPPPMSERPSADHVIVRAGRPEDVSTVLRFWTQATSVASSTDDPESVRALLARDPEALLVAELDGRVVGTLIVGWDGWRAGLYRLAVDPSLRRGGIGGSLVRAGRASSLRARRTACRGGGDRGARSRCRVLAGHGLRARRARRAVRPRSPGRVNRVGGPAVYSIDNCIWGCTGFDLDVHRLGEAGRDPGCLVKRRINTSADNYALAA